MSDIRLESLKDFGKFQEHNVRYFGRLHAISCKAVAEVGYKDALILGHLYYLQNSTPKNGKAPVTEDGSRCVYNSFAQIGERLPFISERCIKERIKNMLVSLDGFTKVRLAGKKTNHYQISSSLAKALDLACKGSKLFFHEREAEAHGILEAVLLQRISYYNTAFTKPYKLAQRIDPIKDFARYSSHRRNVQRALTRMQSIGDPEVGYLVAQDSSKGYVVNSWIRERYMEAPCNGAKLALDTDQTCPDSMPNLHQPLPNLHIQLSPNALRFLEYVGLRGDVEFPNNNEVESTEKNEIAGAAKLVSVPLVQQAYNLKDDQGMEFDCRTPLKASPGMDASHHLTCSVNSSSLVLETRYAKREGSSAVESRTEVNPINDSVTDDISNLRARQSSDLSGMILPCLQEKSLGMRSRSHIGPIVKPKQGPDALLRRFKAEMNELQILLSDDSDTFFNDELRRNPELDEGTLNTIYFRIRESESNDYGRRFAGKFNPFFNSCNLCTSNQVVSRFYLILTDLYRVDKGEYFRTGCDIGRLRDDTPTNVRSYINRKLEARKPVRDPDDVPSITMCTHAEHWSG